LDSQRLRLGTQSLAPRSTRSAHRPGDGRRRWTRRDLWPRIWRSPATVL